MRICIIGTGAMGCVYAALFAEAGHDVVAVDAWKAHVDAINAGGLKLEGYSGDRTVAGIEALPADAPLPGCGLIVVATKASGLRQVAEKIKAESPPGADAPPVLTIQNGLGNADALARGVARERIMVGVAEGFGASIRGPGHAHHNNMARIRLGEYGGGGSERLERIAALWREAGFTAESYDDIDQLVWEKFVCNVALSAPCTVVGCTVGELRADPGLWRIALDCAGEAFAAGKAKGVAFSFDDPEAYVSEFADKLPGARPSMALDHLARRPSEIDGINGMVPVVAAEEGLAAPVNAALAAIVRHREKAFGD